MADFVLTEWRPTFALPNSVGQNANGETLFGTHQLTYRTAKSAFIPSGPLMPDQHIGARYTRDR
jgi:hypothetical protein